MPLTICMALVQRRLPGKCTAQLLGCVGVPSIIACPQERGHHSKLVLGSRCPPCVPSMDAEIAKSNAAWGNGRTPCGFSPPRIEVILRFRVLLSGRSSVVERQLPKLY